MLHSFTLHKYDMKYKYMKSVYVAMLSLLGFVACVNIQSFLLHLSRDVYFVTYFLQLLNNGAQINCVIIFKFKQTFKRWDRIKDEKF